MISPTRWMDGAIRGQTAARSPMQRGSFLPGQERSVTETETTGVSKLRVDGSKSPAMISIASPTAFSQSMKQWSAEHSFDAVDYSDPQQRPLREASPTKLSSRSSALQKRNFMPNTLMTKLPWAESSFRFFYRNLHVYADDKRPFEEVYQVMVISISSDSIKNLLLRITEKTIFASKDSVVIDARLLLRFIRVIRSSISTEPSSNKNLILNLCESVKNQFEEDVSPFMTEFEQKKFSFYMLPYLLTYDLQVVAKEENEYFGAQIIGCKFRTTAFDVKILEVCTSVVKCSGHGFFSAFKIFTIRSYHGTKPLNQLPIVPLEFASPDIKENLIERGSIFRSLGCGTHHYDYAGFLHGQRSGFPEKFLANGRVAVDGANYCRRNPLYRSHRCVITNTETPEDADKSISHHHVYEWKKEAKNKIADLDGCYPWSHRSLSELESDFLPDEMIFKTWPFLPAFSLSIKKWGEVHVSGLNPIAFRDRPLDKVVMDEEKKRLIRSTVEQKDRVCREMELKKSACILLFHGRAGVGKSATAEAVAEHLRLPLYRLSAGELGVSPSELRHELEEVLELASSWRAVLLIDDVDILLESRKEGDIRRNAMKDAFLRLIEEFHGIMFLTTNRVTDFDEAFQNRITVALQFDPLDLFSREKVWHTILQSNGLVGRQSRAGFTKNTTTATQLDLSVMAESADGGQDEDEDMTKLASAANLRRKSSGRFTDSIRSYGDLLASGQGLYDLTSVETHIPALAQYDLNGRQIQMVLRLAKSLALSENIPLSAAHIERVVSIAAQFNLEFL